MVSSEAGEPDQIRPLPESSGGGIGKPPKPTAVGTGGSDDGDDAEKGRANQDSLRDKWQFPLSVSQAFWSLPNLSFYQWNEPKLENAEFDKLIQILDKLHGLDSLIAHLFVSDGSESLHTIGISSLCHKEDGISEYKYLPASLDLMNSLAWPGGGIGSAVSRRDLTGRINSGAVRRTVGALTGSPLIEGKRNNLNVAMRGIAHGVLILAAPVPLLRVKEEERLLLNAIEGATSGLPRLSNQRDRQLLNKIQNSRDTGIWQSCCLYFAALENFSKLETALLGTSNLEVTETALSFRYSDDLTRCLEKFSMPLTKAKHQDVSSLTSYEYLTPLMASELTTFITM